VAARTAGAISVARRVSDCATRSGEVHPSRFDREAGDAESGVGVEDLLDELLAGADHVRAVPVATGVEVGTVDDEAVRARALGA
jgi:hypothetical protein